MIATPRWTRLSRRRTEACFEGSLVDLNGLDMSLEYVMAEFREVLDLAYIYI